MEQCRYIVRQLFPESKESGASDFKWVYIVFLSKFGVI